MTLGKGQEVKRTGIYVSPQRTPGASINQVIFIQTDDYPTLRCN